MNNIHVSKRWQFSISYLTVQAFMGIPDNISLLSHLYVETILKADVLKIYHITVNCRSLAFEKPHRYEFDIVLYFGGTDSLSRLSIAHMFDHVPKLQNTQLRFKNMYNLITEDIATYARIHLHNCHWARLLINETHGSPYIRFLLKIQDTQSNWNNEPYGAQFVVGKEYNRFACSFSTLT